MFLPRTYVAGKNELIDLMYDHAFAEIATDSSPADLAAEARHSFNATGVGENEWWHERSAELEKVCPDFSERFPTLVLMESQGAFVNEDQSKPYLEQEAWETFQFGLEALLDGIQRRLLSEAER